MSANALDLTYDEIKGHVAQSLMWHRTTGGNSGSEANDFNLALKRGVRRVYFNATLPGESQPWTWSFLRPGATLTLNAAYNTGSIAVTNGVVAGTSTVFPSWAANADLWYTATDTLAHRESVASLGGDTSLTLDDTTATPDVAAGTTYSLRQHTYALPDDFAGMASNGFTLRRDQKYLGQIILVNEQKIRQWDDDNSLGVPREAALIPIAATLTQPTRWEVTFRPFTNVPYELDYRYSAVPPNITSTAAYHWGGAPISELMLASILDYAWQIVRDSTEKHQDYLDCLKTAVQQDRKLHPEHTAGQGSRSLGSASFDYQSHLNHQRHNIPYANVTTNW